MKLARRALAAVVALLTLFVLGEQGQAQGTLLRTVTFDGPPTIPPGSGVLVTYYYEEGMSFAPINSGDQLSRSGGGVSFFPENGTAYLLQAAGTSLAGYCAQLPTPTQFGLYSVDLAEFSTLYNYPWTVEFIGYRPDGSTVTIDFTTDRIIDGTGPITDFQTFYFDARFSDLVRFEVPGHRFAMDNLVFFDVIPEPSSFALLLAGGAMVCALRRRCKHLNSTRQLW